MEANAVTSITSFVLFMYFNGSAIEAKCITISDLIIIFFKFYILVCHLLKKKIFYIVLINKYFQNYYQFQLLYSF